MNIRLILYVVALYAVDCFTAEQVVATGNPHVAVSLDI